MKSSVNSSAKASPGLRSSTPREVFALTGTSVRLDPRTHAVRGDLADVRLASQVFAPHYAAAMACVAVGPVTLFERADGGDALADVAPGDGFDVLELAGDHAWGIATRAGLVGYCDRAALALV